VIYVTKTRLAQVEYLIHQAIQGNHVLFEPERIRRALDPQSLVPLSESEANTIAGHIERLVDATSLERKRAYLEGLDSKTYAWVVKTYFNIVENNLFEKQEVLH
jgi:hypothetical protein